MQVNISRLNSGAESYQNLRRLLQNSEARIQEIVSEYRGISCVDHHRGRLTSIGDEISVYAGQCSQLGQVLNSVANLYGSSENRIIDRFEGVRPMNVQASSGMQTTVDTGKLMAGYESGEVSEIGLMDIVSMMLGTADVADEWSSNAGLIGKWASVFEDSEFAKFVKDYTDSLRDGTLFDIAGYIGDHKDLMEAWESGDLGGVEKYFQKMGSSLINETIYSGGKVLTGIEGGVYLDFAWNLGKDVIEKGTEVIQNPSVGSVAGLLWESTVENYGQALWNSGTKLASDSLSLLYGVFGQDFDEADFNQAMDFLGGAFEYSYNAVKGTVIDAGKAVWNGIGAAASWFGSLF